MPDLHVTALDLTILLVYVIGTRILFGWYLARRTSEGSESYFLAGHRIPWPLIGFSFYVSNMSGSSFVGLPASGYADGIAVYNYEWLPALILVFFIWFILPFYVRARVYTAPQFLETRYGRAARLAFSSFLLTANIFIDAATTLYAGATIVQTLYPSVPLWVSVAAMAFIAGAYIFFGGLGAVVINDALQATLILAGGLAISILAWLEVPSWDAVREAAPDRALRLFRPADDPVLPWPGIITGLLPVGIYFWCMNQFVIQRAMGARNLDHGRWGSLFAGFLKLPNLFILVLPGVFATVLYPNLENPDLVFPALAFDLLPIGLRGLMLAALAAATLSSLEAIFNSASTLFTIDFVKTLRPQTADRSLVWVGRIATLAFMALAAVWAPRIEGFPTLWRYVQSVLAYVTPPIVAVFLLGIFWRRANHPGALATLAIGVPVGIAGWVINEIAGLTRLQFLYASGILFAASCLVLVVTSLITPPPPPDKVKAHTWRWELWRRESADLSGTPWYRNHRVLSAILLALTAAIVAWWW